MACTPYSSTSYRVRLQQSLRKYHLYKECILPISADSLIDELEYELYTIFYPSISAIYGLNLESAHSFTILTNSSFRSVTSQWPASMGFNS
jgi:hypothetical protein